MGVVRGAAICLGLTMFGLPFGQLQAQNANRTFQPVPRSVDTAQPYTTPESTSEGVLREMADRAAVIFVGTVTAVRKGRDEATRSSASASVVEVDFAVESAVKGPTDGAVYTLREWAGLWQDSARFTVGQRFLMVLHAPGPGGLSSPIDGLNGAIPIKAAAAVPSLPAQPSALATVDAENTLQNAAQDDAVDMRWLQARTLRTQIFADDFTASPGESSPSGVSVATPLAHAVAAVSAEPPASAGLAHVLGLLKSWRETGNVSH